MCACVMYQNQILKNGLEVMKQVWACRVYKRLAYWTGPLKKQKHVSKQSSRNEWQIDLFGKRYGRSRWPKPGWPKPEMSWCPEIYILEVGYSGEDCFRALTLDCRGAQNPLTGDRKGTGCSLLCHNELKAFSWGYVALV